MFRPGANSQDRIEAGGPAPWLRRLQPRDGGRTAHAATASRLFPRRIPRLAYSRPAALFLGVLGLTPVCCPVYRPLRTRPPCRGIAPSIGRGLSPLRAGGVGPDAPNNGRIIPSGIIPAGDGEPMPVLSQTIPIGIRSPGTGSPPHIDGPPVQRAGFRSMWGEQLGSRNDLRPDSPYAGIQSMAGRGRGVSGPGHRSAARSSPGMQPADCSARQSPARRRTDSGR
jgi:hypothetical protein